MDAITALKLERVENDVDTMRRTQRAMLDYFYRSDKVLIETRDIAAENRTRLERVEDRQGKLIAFARDNRSRLERVEKRQDKLIEIVLENRAMIEDNRALIEQNRSLIEQNGVLIEQNRVSIEQNRASIEHNGAMIREVQLMLFTMCEQMGLTMELPGKDPKPD